METYGAAGGPPDQWIELDLGESHNLASVELVVSQTSRGTSAHEVDVSEEPIGHDADGARLAYRIEGTTDNGQVPRVLLSPDLETFGRYVQIRTARTIGWVAWREVRVFAPSD